MSYDSIQALPMDGDGDTFVKICNVLEDLMNIQRDPKDSDASEPNASRTSVQKLDLFKHPKFKGNYSFVPDDSKDSEKYNNANATDLENNTKVLNKLLERDIDRVMLHPPNQNPPNVLPDDLKEISDVDIKDYIDNRGTMFGHFTRTDNKSDDNQPIHDIETGSNLDISSYDNNKGTLY